MNFPFKHEKTDDFCKLSGISVLITRPENQTEKLKSLFEQQGATVEIQPAIEILPPESWDEVDKVIKQIASFDYVVFSSENGVNCFLNRVEELEQDLGLLKGKKVAAVGSGTAALLQQRGVTVSIIPTLYRAENLSAAIIDDIAQEKRDNSNQNKPAEVLLLSGSRGRDVLYQTLSDYGANVTRCTVYQSVDVTEPSKDIILKLNSQLIDWVVFTSTSIAKATINMLGDRLKNTKIACISPLTASAVTQKGFVVDVIAENYTMEGLVDAIVAEKAKG